MSAVLPDAFRQVRFLCDEEELPETFFIVTAYNPDGVTVPDRRNAKADQTLKDAIEKKGLHAFRVTGGDFDFSHEEPGWGIECTRDEARALSSSFRQLAFFEIRDGKVILVPTDPSGGEEEDLGDWDLRLDDGDPACPFCLTRAMQYPCDHLLTTFDSWGGSWTLEEGFYDGIYDDLVKGRLATADDEEDPSEKEEERRSRVIRETLHAVADKITQSGLDQGPGFSSNLEFLWVRDPNAAHVRLRDLLTTGGLQPQTNKANRKDGNRSLGF